MGKAPGVPGFSCILKETAGSVRRQDGAQVLQAKAQTAGDVPVWGLSQERRQILGAPPLQRRRDCPDGAGSLQSICKGQGMMGRPKVGRVPVGREEEGFQKSQPAVPTASLAEGAWALRWPVWVQLMSCSWGAGQRGEGALTNGLTLCGFQQGNVSSRF